MTDRKAVAVVVIAMLIEVAVGAWSVWDAVDRINDIPVFVTKETL